jgi:anti-sigma B factor antagonist
VPEERRAVQWLGQVAVVPVPVEVDISNADNVRDDLLSVLKEGPVALVVDMSRTTFCDSAGVNALVRVYQQALAAGVAVRLVVTTSAVQRVLAITGVDRLIDTFPTVQAAVAAAAPAAAPQEAAGEEGSGDGVTGGCAAPERSAGH